MVGFGALVTWSVLWRHPAIGSPAARLKPLQPAADKTHDLPTAPGCVGFNGRTGVAPGPTGGLTGRSGRMGQIAPDMPPNARQQMKILRFAHLLGQTNKNP